MTILILPREFKTFKHCRVWQCSIFDIDKELPNSAFLDITELDGSFFLQQSVEFVDWEHTLLVYR